MAGSGPAKTADALHGPSLEFAALLPQTKTGNERDSIE